MVKAIIFDIGGVVQSSDREQLYQELAGYVGVSVEEIREEFPRLVDPLGRGLITEKQFYQSLLGEFGKQKDIPPHSLFLEGQKTVHTNSDILNLITTLREKGYKIVALSNTIAVYTDNSRSKGFYDPFDLVILSHEVGMRKPEKEIYELTLQKLGILPKETVFIDDSLENIKGAEAVGIHGIHFTGDMQTLLRGLHSLGVEV